MDADIEKLRKYYQDLQILEIVFTVANNNATNRWTDSLGIPAEPEGSALMRAVGKTKGEFRTFLTPTADRYKNRASQVAALQPGQPTGPAVPAKRPPLESRAEVEAALTACRMRTPRLPLMAEDKARSLLPEDHARGALPEWVRLLANFPKGGIARVLSLHKTDEKGLLNRTLKHEVAWIAARQDRAWYALGQAKRQLASDGLSEEAIYALGGNEEKQSPAEQAALAFARKLTAKPYLIADGDIAELRKHYKDAEVAELVLHVCNAAFFDRVTEAAGLRLEQK
jgi:alkylhydroperoxidase family enzyme